jgi:hypothetical protein
MYPSFCAFAVMSLEARPFQIFRLMRLYELKILHMVLMLESGHAVDAANSTLALGKKLRCTGANPYLS